MYYYNEFKIIIEKILKGNFEKNLLIEYLIDMFDCEKIYDSDDEMATDIFLPFWNCVPMRNRL